MFQERIKRGQDVYTNELLYPIMQAYDSVAMDVDLEIGGRDQTFNMLMGRKLMRNMKQKDKFVMSLKLIEDAEGKKIGKTEGNAISLVDKPSDLYGNIMAFPDEVLMTCFECLTHIPMDQLIRIKQQLNEGVNPMHVKKQLAHTLVELLHSSEDAQKAQEFFEAAVQKREIPELTNVREVNIDRTTSHALVDMLVTLNIVGSKSQAKQLIRQHAIDVNGKTIEELNYQLPVNRELTIKTGKYRFEKIKLVR